MPDPQHLAFLKEVLLKQEISRWNKWRHEHADERIDLSDADLQKADLSGIDLQEADLSGIDLRNANLTGANLNGTVLDDAVLDGAIFENAELRNAKIEMDLFYVNLPAWNRWREDNTDIQVDLSEKDFTRDELPGVNFNGCILYEANLRAADLRGANLREADLGFADLIGADLTGADLVGANLSDAFLCGADLSKANLSFADLQRTRMDTQEDFVQDDRVDNPRADFLRHNLEKEHLRTGKRWREERSTDLSNAILRGANLNQANLSKVILTSADLQEANLTANLSGAWLENANLFKADLNQANLEDAVLSHSKLCGANLHEAFLGGATLTHADLRGADLRKAYLRGVNLIQAKLGGADLREADLSPDIEWTRLNSANLTKADLRETNLGNTDLTNAVFAGADLRGAFLREAQLVGTDLRGANLGEAYVYGISVWDVRINGKTKQNGLIITPENMPRVTVDDVEVAQFIYLLMENRKIRNIIQTVTSRAVLILGRFTKERKPILEAIHTEMKDTYGLVPILVDFVPSSKRSVTETIQLLANLCRFIVADVTDAKSIPQELSHIIPNMPSVPVQPIIEDSQEEYAMFKHWRSFNSVLPEFLYRDERHLLENIEAYIIKPVEEWEKETKKAAVRERLLQEKIKQLQDENNRLRAMEKAND